MDDVVYRIVEHDGGWAYKLGDVFSETFPNRRAAETAANRVAEEQRSPGEDEAISWEDEAGVWHEEAARGVDRPNAYVADLGAARPAGPRPTGFVPPERQNAPDGVGDYAFAAYDRGDQYARRGASLARAQVRSDPLAAMLLAVVLGFLLGLVMRKKA